MATFQITKSNGYLLPLRWRRMGAPPAATTSKRDDRLALRVGIFPNPFLASSYSFAPQQPLLHKALHSGGRSTDAGARVVWFGLHEY
jgi:hypothetical protein